VEQTTDNDREADLLYAKARAVAMIQKEGDRSPISVSLASWLKWLVERPNNPVAPNTFSQYQRIVWSFTACHGQVLGRELKAWHLEDWLKRMQQERLHPQHRGPVRR